MHGCNCFTWRRGLAQDSVHERLDQTLLATNDWFTKASCETYPTFDHMSIWLDFNTQSRNLPCSILDDMKSGGRPFKATWKV